MRVQQQKIEEKVVRDLLAILNQAQTDISKMLTQNVVYNRQALQATFLRIDAMAEILNATLTRTIAEGSAQAGLYTYNEMNAIMGWDGLYRDYNRVTSTLFELATFAVETPIAGRTLSEWVATAFVDPEEVRKVVTGSIAKGEGYDKMIEALKEIMPDTTEKDIETLARTYGQAMNNKALDDIYKANEEVIEYLEWSAILEVGYVGSGTGTCQRCAALDGNKYEVNGYHPDIPLHPR